MAKTHGEPGARETGTPGSGGDPRGAPPETAALRPRVYLTPWRSAVLLVAGDKSGQWKQWYRTAIPQAEQLYEDYLAELEKETGR